MPVKEEKEEKEEKKNKKEEKEKKKKLKRIEKEQKKEQKRRDKSEGKTGVLGKILGFFKSIVALVIEAAAAVVCIAAAVSSGSGLLAVAGCAALGFGTATAMNLSGKKKAYEFSKNEHSPKTNEPKKRKEENEKTHEIDAPEREHQEPVQEESKDGQTTDNKKDTKEKKTNFENDTKRRKRAVGAVAYSVINELETDNGIDELNNSLGKEAFTIGDVEFKKMEYGKLDEPGKYTVTKDGLTFEIMYERKVLTGQNGLIISSVPFTEGTLKNAVFAGINEKILSSSIKDVVKSVPSNTFGRDYNEILDYAERHDKFVSESVESKMLEIGKNIDGIQSGKLSCKEQFVDINNGMMAKITTEPTDICETDSIKIVLIDKNTNSPVSTFNGVAVNGQLTPNELLNIYKSSVEDEIKKEGLEKAQEAHFHDRSVDSYDVVDKQAFKDTFERNADEKHINKKYEPIKQEPNNDEHQKGGDR